MVIEIRNGKVFNRLRFIFGKVAYEMKVMSFDDQENIEDVVQGRIFVQGNE